MNIHKNAVLTPRGERPMDVATSMGVSVSIRQVIMSTLWVEFYGTANLGSIRSLATACSASAAALAPVAIGALIDVGVLLHSAPLR